MNKKIAIILSGCGHLDGSEITESVACLISLSQFPSVEVTLFAPSVDKPVVNGLTKEPQGTRNLLVESSRIARGKIYDLNHIQTSDFDGVIFPGGYGVAKNLSSWAEHGSKGSVEPIIRKIILDFYQESKPIGALCIAPILLACVLGSKGVSLTVGRSTVVMAEVLKTGAHPVPCDVTDYITDREHKILTTPAYMDESATAFEVFTGIQKMIKELVEMA